MSVKSVRKISNCIIVFLIVFIAVMTFKADTAIPISANGQYGIINSGDPKKGEVALMIGVYDGKEQVQKILSVLKEKHVKATFFVGGCFADDNKELLLDILTDGHELGNYGYFHMDMKKVSEKTARQEIYLNHELIRALCGYNMKLFCPPTLTYSLTTLKVADKLGYKTIICTRDTLSLKEKDANSLFKRATDGVSGGDFIMFYPTDATVAVLDRILDFYQNSGLKATSVGELL